MILPSPFSREIQSLLEYCNLPCSDLTEASDVEFYSVRDEKNQRLIAVVGLERLASKTVLLRSLAVDERYRGTGLGQKMVRHAEKIARSESIEEIWLLTDSASGFFHKLGYRNKSRVSAPKPVLDSAQFRNLCPSSVDLMMKRLSSGTSA